MCRSGQEPEWVGGGVRQIAMVAWTWLGSPSSLGHTQYPAIWSVASLGDAVKAFFFSDEINI